jgi:CRP-like cAMP-binding protein
VRHVIASIAVSGFGTWSYNVGIAVYAFQMTHSATWVAVVTVGRYVPAIVLSWRLSALLDRLPRRGLAIGGDVVCAAVMVALSILGGAHAPVWLVTIVAAVSSTAARIQAAGVLSLAADVVAESQLARASVLTAASEAVATAAGSAAASLLLLRFDPPALFLVNAATFLLSAALLAGVPSVPVRRRPPASRSDDGRRAPSVHTQVWPLQASRAVAAYVYGMDVVLLTVIAHRQIGSGAGGYGWLLAAAGLGGLLALAPARRFLTGGSMTASVSSAAMACYCLPLLVFVTSPPLAGGIAVQVVRGAGAVIVTSSVMSALQWGVPSAEAGRVFGATQSLVLVGTCVGSLTTPVLLSVWGFGTTIVIGAVAPLTAQLLLQPLLTRFHRRDPHLVATLDPRLAVLRRLDMLRDASRATLYRVADAVSESAVPAGTVLMHEGEASDALYVIVSGEVEVTGGPGRQVYRRQSGPDYVGEIGLIRGIPRTATVTTLTPCRVWRVPGEVFLAATSEAGASGALLDTLRIRFDTSPGPRAAVRTDAVG